MNHITKIGIVALPRISVGGGFARATRDLIAALNEMDVEVHLLTPFEVDLQKIAELYGPIRLASIRRPSAAKVFFSRDEILGRKLLKEEFKKLARDVDFIIDLDGAVLHRYLPKNFDRDNYAVWRLSCINPNTYKLQGVRNLKVLAKILIKRTLKKIITRSKDIPRGLQVYPLDEWTKREIIQFWHMTPQTMCLYPEIKVEEFSAAKRKRDQAVILGRIAPNKSIHESLEIFHRAIKNHPSWRLVIIGGTTPDSPAYVALLKELIKKYNLGDKVDLIQDPSFAQIKQILSESKIIIDSQRGTSMNMPVVEALASGCAALMHRNSGTYTEVLGNGEYGYGFEGIEEGANVLETILSEKKLDVEKSIQRAEFYSSRKFRDRLHQVLRR